ncbi:thiamine biosynthesis protein ThiS [Pontibacter korlensis]|uniref:Thiamine biosynthesis protein ThiS n=1 Tax=Pontibacter korlensis TaxID=400092 RepID=A0A0E3ZFC7_9BACT|nr:sulfur carrier protein ThiS [Pontibacter korlensis]AKD04259.1 thiamine biosynthesis protein ThiS [Pontibacter korlensis]
MDISVNQQAQTVADNCSLQQLLQILLPQNQNGIAIAVNNAIVPKPSWAEHLLHPNDSVTIIRATQGG